MDHLIKYYIYFTFLINCANAQQCTFEDIYPIYPSYSSNHRIVKSKNTDILYFTTGAYDSTRPGEDQSRHLIHIRKFGPCGNLKCYNKFGLAEGNYIDGVVESDSGDVLAVGWYGFEPGFRVLKIKNDCSLIFEKRYLVNSDSKASNIVKLSGNRFLISGNNTPIMGQSSVPFVLCIDGNGDILQYNEFPQTFRVNKVHGAQFVGTLYDSIVYFVLARNYEAFDTTYRYFPDTQYTIHKNNYTDIIIANLDTDLKLKDWYSITELKSDSIRENIGGISGVYIKSVNDSTIFIEGENIFTDFRMPPPTNRLLNSSAYFSISQRKIISRIKHDIGESLLYPLSFNDDLLSLYNNPEDSSFIVRDKNFNIIKTIKTTNPQKFTIFPKTSSFPTRNSLATACLTDDHSIIAVGTSTYRKIKSLDYDSLLNPHAAESYIIKIDSNGNFTPTTWNNIKDQKEYSLIINIFPNPTDNKINIQLPKSFYNIEIFDIKGNLMKSYNHIDNEVQIETGSLVEGLYLLKATDITNGNIHTQKFIVRRH